MTTTTENLAPLISNTKWTSRAGLLFTIRAMQFALSVTAMGLTAYVINFGISDDFTRLVLATSAISLVYLLSVFVATVFAPGKYVPGTFFIFELLVTALWFAAFVALAQFWGMLVCSDLVVVYYYYIYDLRLPCKCAQAAIAMAGASWLFYMFSSVFFIANIVKPFSQSQKSVIWDPLISHNLTAHRGTGLAVIPVSTDIEGSYTEQNGTSQESNVEQASEKAGDTTSGPTGNGIISDGPEHSTGSGYVDNGGGSNTENTT